MARSTTTRSAAILAAVLLAAALPARGADEASGLGAETELVIPRVEVPPRLEDFVDMQLPDRFAGKLALVEGFIQQTPEDGRQASQRTQVYLGYDSHSVYLVFLAFDSEPEKIRAHMGRRENIFGDEIVEVQFDTFNDQRRAFSFIVNPLGVQSDAIWTEGQRFDFSWDAVWQSRGRLTDKGYVVWMAIPFKSLRFPGIQEQTWRIVLVRDIPRNNESSFWPRISNRIEGRLNQAATLRGLRGISPGRNVLLIPYATSRNFKLLDEGSAEFTRENFDADAGIDAKLVIKDRLALDLTFNPDFSQVESDEPQVTVNQRFELFFPEKRPFFLENADLFSTDFNLLFTRNISEPRLGARLTGKLGPYSLGLLAIDDEAPGKRIGPDDPFADELTGERARFGVLRLVRDVARQSRIGLTYTDRRFGDSRNRVGSVDGRIKLDDNWVSRFQLARSSKLPQEGPRENGGAYSLQFDREGRKLYIHSHYREIGPDFETEVGFVPRVDIRDLHQRVEYTFRPEGPKLLAWGPSLFVQRIEDHEGTRLDLKFNSGIEWEFRRQTEFGLFYDDGRERLRAGDAAGIVSPLDFRTHRWSGFVGTRFLRAVTGSFGLTTGRTINIRPAQPEDDELPRNPPVPADTLRGEVQLTLRPLGNLRIDNEYLFTRLTGPEDGRRIFTNRILRSKWNWQLNPKLSLRAIVQYDSTRTDPELSAEQPGRDLNGDLLLTYLVNPWTAIYAGYNTNYRDLELVPGPGGSSVVRAPGLDLEDRRQLFFKVSYLFRP